MFFLYLKKICSSKGLGFFRIYVFMQCKCKCNCNLRLLGETTGTVRVWLNQWGCYCSGSSGVHVCESVSTQAKKDVGVVVSLGGGEEEGCGAAAAQRLGDGVSVSGYGAGSAAPQCGVVVVEGVMCFQI